MIKRKADEATFRPVVGIDLGTTNSGVAQIVKQKATMMPLSTGEVTLPSVVLLNEDGRVSVGEKARNALVAMPERSIAAVKRHMGEDVMLPLGDEFYSPEELSAFIIREIKQVVDRELGEGDKEAVITVPAYFTNAQRQATKRAGELAGFVVERIINEPTAAALAYGLQHLKKDAQILVYDLGGGTFDVSVVELMSGILEVKATAGDHELGGEDFDWKIVDWMAEQVLEDYDLDPRKNVRANALLKTEAEDVKKALSTDSEVPISLPVLMLHEGAPVGLDTVLDRDTLISLIEPLLLETKKKLEQVLEEADLQPGDIDEVLLVGGSTRIPYVHQLVKDVFGREPRSDIHPDEVVALGAAVQGGIKSGVLDREGMIVTDVAPFSMGISVLKQSMHHNGRSVPGAFSAIIAKNTIIPVTRTQKFDTSYDDQTEVKIEIYQGEEEWVKDNYFLNEFFLEGLKGMPKGQESVDVTFRYNLNGILEVKAKSVNTDAEMKVTIDDELDRSTEDAFYDSLARVESAGMKQDDVFDPDTDIKDKQDEARVWLERMNETVADTDLADDERIKQVTAKLKDAIEKADPAQLDEAIERAVDLAIDMEFDE